MGACLLKEVYVYFVSLLVSSNSIPTLYLSLLKIIKKKEKKKKKNPVTCKLRPLPPPRFMRRAEFMGTVKCQWNPELRTTIFCMNSS